jgi:aspartyl-tRNA(Asn)/glutamyl-tRNA(Gln) amidotransferase subunit A
MDTIGPMSRTVADCAMTLQAIAGHDPKDPYTSRAPAPDFSAALTGDLTGLRVGVVKERLHTEDVALDIRQAVAQGIEVIKGLGAKVEEVSMPMIVHTAAFSMVIGLVEGASVHREYVNNRLQEYQHEQRLVQLVGSLIPAHTYYKAQRLRQMWRAQMLETLEKYDVLVYPTGPTVAPTVPPATGLQNRADAKADLYGRRSFTHPVNLAGVPALSVNCGFTQDGLPIGMQIIGRLFEDATVLGVGHAYEQATEWHKRRPPI